MAARCIVLDFDGTFTRVDEEAASFVPLYREHLGQLVGQKPDAFIAQWAAIDSRMDASPSSHGWTDAAGRIVAPAYADPYVKSRAIAGQILDDAHLFMAQKDRVAVLEYLFGLGRSAVIPVFRPEAAQAIQALAATGARLYVVTNSGTVDVKKKLEAHLREAAAHLDVRGDSKKFVLRGEAEAWAGPGDIPLSMRLAGLERPVYLHRPHYLAVLERIWAECGAGPQDTLVCGDIFELDLALPAALGASIALITRPNTPSFELDAARTHPRGRVISALTELSALAA
jgi:FMN phosphatase YigB (HAD superfamily)